MMPRLSATSRYYIISAGNNRNLIFLSSGFRGLLDTSSPPSVWWASLILQVFLGFFDMCSARAGRLVVPIHFFARILGLLSKLPPARQNFAKNHLQEA